MPVVNGVKSYSLLKTEEIAPIVYGVKSNEYIYIYIWIKKLRRQSLKQA